MEQKPTFITDDNPNKDINVAFYNLPLVKRYGIRVVIEVFTGFKVVNLIISLFLVDFNSTSMNCRLRELATSEVGKLVSVTGVVTRTSEVRPELLQGTFKCLDCGNVVKNVEQQFKYTEVCNYTLM